MTLHTIKPSPGSRKRKLRVGRGLARRGAMSGRGTKGQRARSGGKSGLKVKGLRQTLLRIPKSRGFKSPVVKAATVSLRDVNDVSLKVISPSSLKKIGLVKETRYGVKILGTGALTKALTVKGCQVTQSAKKQIEAAGGTIAS
ncbi:50S ribosomal protein L15 [Candidatus Uhrbacteria bacterium RIFCSPLOWO2_01_FULL_53_9]|uniref:Large ribosomal subunit protein uL15 n=3 Tax=Candidatus Uhriibacteriota TaxID=1752732 RepID=A0A1F7UWS3_9BACT|nr:MAG: 50S ribosomal protein L15 [Candidatus Uhrbacteria bacterium RIFCSPHIGHO2_02_FULL_53_13]OGL82740.1 MAG: 50S ribosomal protein L15 [Candidatus Uhrbacteria bacterium RIFCSPLOWO2_01_FULL_53_9]OGL89089.1 MAG: 50S ribosomal protein L15 [Candidatus Uhrbacteria bacterium RIFCSPLOWO2_02_FULL_53_10]